MCSGGEAAPAHHPRGVGAGEGVLPEVTGGSGRWRVKRRSRPTSLSFTGSDVGPDGKYPPRTQKKDGSRLPLCARRQSSVGTAG